MIGSARSGERTEASTGERQIGNRMPASIAAAIGVGIPVTARVRAGHRPVSSVSTPATTKAPTAAAKCSVVECAAIRSAAPGDDQAKESGVRKRSDRMTASSPCVMHRASNPEAASAGEAPTAVRPAMTRAKVLAKPVTAPTMPATMGWTMVLARRTSRRRRAPACAVRAWVPRCRGPPGG